MLRRIFLVTLCFLAVALCSNVALADTITVSGAQSDQRATATIVCEFNSQTNTFTFTVTNTSAITTPGSTATITAIGYDLPPAGNASSSGLNGFTGMQAPSLSSNFIFSDADVGSIPQFSAAVADFAFLTGPSGTFGTGSVNDGLLPGESASFTVSGAAFTGFTEAQICNSIFIRFQNTGAGDGTDVGVSEQGNWVPDPPADQIVGIETGSQATATVVCEFNSQTNTFTFTITNTSAITSPGSNATITAIGYDLPPDGNLSDSGLNGFTGSQAPSLSSDFRFSDADLGTVPGFGDAVLDFGFITGKNFAGGKVKSGLAPGESASFVVSGAAFAGFTEEQICDSIFVRFQRVGADGEGSDVGVPVLIDE